MFEKKFNFYLENHSYFLYNKLGLYYNGNYEHIVNNVYFPG